MIFRILILLAVFALMYFLATLLLSYMNRNVCRNCDGQGYWIGVRGDRNHCKVCDGSGKNT